MKINEIITILENRVINLNVLKNMAQNNGDLDAVIRIEKQIQETEESLFYLKRDHI